MKAEYKTCGKNIVFLVKVCLKAPETASRLGLKLEQLFHEISVHDFRSQISF